MDDSAAMTSSAPAAASAAVAASRVPATAATAAPPPPAPPQQQETQQQQPPAPPPPPAAAAAPGGDRRQSFSVELRPGETTIVSWKRLLKEAGHSGRAAQPVAAIAEPPFDAPPGPVHPAENDPKDPAQPNRFSAVIEKIERLYMGKQSSDEEDLDDVPDDDQYDTEDSFIDDTELDEYFQVDNLATKHSGYFVNKGKLEQIESGSSPNVAPKKRRRRDSSSAHLEYNQEFVLGDHSSIGSMPGKGSVRIAPQVGKTSSSNLDSYGEYYYEDNREMKTKTHKKKSADFTVNTENAAHTKVSSKDAPSAPLEIREFEKHKAAATRPIDVAPKSRTGETYDYTYPMYRDKDTAMQLDLQPRKEFNGDNQYVSTKIRRKEKYGIGEFSGMSTAGTVYATQAMHSAAPRSIEGSGTKTKGTRLERAIRDLQKFVTESRPPTLDIHEVDPNCQAAVKRRLPPEVKQKLAKVARLSASQGKIPEHELMDRLMSILGHLVQRRTLKKNMKEMVESGLSAKQEKADRFHQVKMEINEMIKARVATKAEVTEQQDGSADDFQEVVNNDERSLKGKSIMDATLEDRICDLYDLYVEGMDEDKGPQSRKLYVELAELWPQGCMDKVGIKDAIYRSKERRRLLYRQHKVRNEERMKRKRLAAAAKLQDGNPVMIQTAVPPHVAQPYMTNSVATFAAVDYGQNQGLKNFGRIREMTTGTVSDDSNRNTVDMKKKKRKSETDIADVQANPPKVALHHGKDKQKPHMHADEANVGSLPPKATVPILGLPSYDQQPS